MPDGEAAVRNRLVGVLFARNIGEGGMSWSSEWIDAAFGFENCLKHEHRLEPLNSSSNSLPEYFTPGPPSPPFYKTECGIRSIRWTMTCRPHQYSSQTGHLLAYFGPRPLHRAYCLKHEHRLEPLNSSSTSTLGGAVGRYERCKITKRQLKYVICIEPITGDYVACLSCGCASH
ncbi:hypothetical protein GMDG_08272 [Pseudogymnoascus destructans 20631-21]|uniref:Uncharacterized protein n=1 Tax=Pseudogymnoascus destructans (strain ATCC MYA-4855 / 20631-21) TaxID=658429 RepID=L8G1H4_PSED2|nr:hypothetical protein GMDG_08272 [Pseudogymnoascus destructans 20631-21]